LAGTYNSQYTGYSNTITASPAAPSISLVSSQVNIVCSYTAPGGVSYTITGVNNPVGQFQFNVPVVGQFRVVGLSIGSTYEISLVVTYPSGAIGTSNPIQVTVLPIGPITITNQIGAAPTSITVSFSGTAVDNFYSYIWYTVINSGDYYFIDQPSSPYIFTYQGLSEGQVYNIQIIGYNSSIDEYVESNIFQGYTIN
jgi:hypothetical protein